MHRRALLAATLATPAIATQALAQAWRPERPIRAIVPFAPGGTTDVVARLLAEPTGAILGQPIVIENRPGGAAGLVGTDAVAKSAPDGHTILINSNAHAIAPALVARMPYHAADDFAGLAMLGRVPQVLCVNPRTPANSMAELIALLRREPGRHHFASAGIGSAVHMGGEVFRATAGVDVAPVHYRGGGPAMQAVITGEAIYTVDPVASALGHIRGGSVRALVVAGAERVANLPDVPSAAEAGLPAFAVDTWVVAVAPARTPAPAVAALNAAFHQGMRTASARLLEQSVFPMPQLQTPEQVIAFIRTDMARSAEVMRAAGVRPE